MPDKDIVEVLENQASNTKSEFETRTNEVLLQLAEQVNYQIHAFKYYD
jgi:hypothetical protein